MTHEITPQVGYGPIKFGMSSAEVEQILGVPSKTEAAVPKGEKDEEEIEHYGNQHYSWYGENHTDSNLPQITYADDKVIGITIFKQSGPLTYKGMDLHEFKKREEVLEVLAQGEDTYYYNEQFYFYPKSGLVIASPENMKRFFFVELTLTQAMMPHLVYEMYEPYTDLD